jgi:hypothetical protein
VIRSEEDPTPCLSITGMLVRSPLKRSGAILCAYAALMLGGCGGGSGAADRRVAPGVKGSGEAQLLGDPAFRSALSAVGISPHERPIDLMGVDLGRRLRAIITDSGRLDPAPFSEPYRSFLRSRGRLSERAFSREYGGSPVAMATRVGMLVGLLDARLNEGAKPAPILPSAILSGFGARELPTVARGAKDCGRGRRAQHAVSRRRPRLRRLPGELSARVHEYGSCAAESLSARTRTDRRTRAQADPGSM